MSLERTVQSLSRLVELRERDVERMTAELASQQALRVRYQQNLRQMEHLLSTAGSSDMGCPALSSNSAHYKASLVDLIIDHHRDMQRHDEVIAASQQALTLANLRHKCLDVALQGKRQLLDRAQQAREQKQQDQLATQSWLRGRLSNLSIA